MESRVNFIDRIQKSQSAIERFDKYLAYHSIPYALTGYEDLAASEPFMQRIRQLNDTTSNRIRYFPDRCVVGKKTRLVEIKHSDAIEKDAYDTYIDLSSIGYDVAIVVLHNKKMLFADINDVVIKAAHSNRIPVVDGKWLAPRELPENEYLQWKRISHGSGTTHGWIDFETTPFIELEETNAP